MLDTWHGKLRYHALLQVIFNQEVYVWCIKVSPVSQSTIGVKLNEIRNGLNSVVSLAQPCGDCFWEYIPHGYSYSIVRPKVKITIRTILFHPALLTDTCKSFDNEIMKMVVVQNYSCLWKPQKLCFLKVCTHIMCFNLTSCSHWGRLGSGCYVTEANWPINCSSLWLRYCILCGRIKG